MGQGADGASSYDPDAVRAKYLAERDKRLVEGREYVTSAWLERTPDLDSLRGEARFQALLS